MGTTYDLDADLSKLEAELAKGDRGFTAVAASADKAAAAVKKAGGEADKAADSAGKAGESWADLAAGMGGIVETGKAVLETITGVVGGALELAREVASASEELKGFVSEDDLARIEGLGDSFDAADTAALTLKASIVTELEPALQGAIDAFIGASSRAREFSGSLGEVVDGEGSEGPGFFEALANSISATGTAGAFTVGTLRLLGGGYQLLAAEGKEAREEIEKITAAQEEQKEAAKETASEVKTAAKSIAKSEEDLHAARVKAVLEGKKLEAQAIADRLKDHEAMLASMRLGVLAWHEEQAKLFQEETEATADRMMAETDQWERDWKARKEAAKDAALESAQAWADAFATISDLNLENKAETLDSIQEQMDATRDQIKDAEGQRKRDLEWHLEVLKVEEEEAKKSANRAFFISQAAATSSAIASGAAAFAAMLLTFAPLGWGAPIAAAAVVTPTVGAQLATISQNKPPAHSGMSFGADEFLLGPGQMVRDGESMVIFNQRATEQGAPERAMELNRGQPPSAPPPRLVIADGGRVIAELAARDARRPGSPFGRRSSGFTDPHRRGR